MNMQQINRNEAGLVGKIIVVWLLIVGVLGVAVVDAASIAFAHFRLDDAAQVAAVTAATNFRNTHDATSACQAAKQSVQTQSSDAQFPQNFCKVDRATGDVTITLKKTANTLIAGRLSFTRDYTHVIVKETGRPSDV